MMSYEIVKLREYVKYINIISSVLLMVSLICIVDLCLCAYGYNNMPSYEVPKSNSPTRNVEGLKPNGMLFAIITLGLSTASVIISSIFLFLIAMKIIHVAEVGSILNGMHSTSKSNAQRPLLQDYEVPITPDNSQNRPRTNNLYTDRNQGMMSIKEEKLPVYDEVNEEPTFPSNRHNMSPPIGYKRKEMPHTEELPDYDEVKEFNVASFSRKMVPPMKEEEQPEYHEPVYPNVPSISQQSRYYDRLREEPEELVDYDEVKTVDVEINTGCRIMKTSNNYQQSSVYEEEIIDYDEVKNEEMKTNSASTSKKYSDRIQKNLSTDNLTETSSMSNKVNSKSLEDLLQTLDIPSNDKLENNPNISFNEIKNKNINKLYNKEMMNESTRKVNYGIKTNPKNETKTHQNSSNNQTPTKDNDGEDSDYDYIKN